MKRLSRRGSWIPNDGMTHDTRRMPGSPPGSGHSPGTAPLPAVLDALQAAVSRRREEIERLEALRRDFPDPLEGSRTGADLLRSKLRDLEVRLRGFGLPVPDRWET